jgi:hypothetical protein
MPPVGLAEVVAAAGQTKAADKLPIIMVVAEKEAYFKCGISCDEKLTAFLITINKAV